MLKFVFCFSRTAVRTDTCHIVAISLNLQQKVHPVIWSLGSLPFDCFMALAIPKPIGESVECCYLCMLLPVYVVTCVCCYLCVLLPVYVVTCVCCYLCMLLPVRVVTCVCCYLCMLLPVYVTCYRWGPGVCCQLAAVCMLLPVCVVTCACYLLQVGSWCLLSTRCCVYVVTCVCCYLCMLPVTGGVLVFAVNSLLCVCCYLCMLLPVCVATCVCYLLQVGCWCLPSTRCCT